ncbi:MAG: 1-acyl-sn-glycerol-3-phosphate acyltransferase [Phycisphaerales bacterium]|nr:1-acyl-sn-glycerol-3-phosphate acyltransferase [Phycisphaerales bacterium]
MFARLRAKRPGATLFQLLFYEFIRTAAALLFILCYRARAYHASRIPVAGPLLLAANHESYLDPPLVGSFLHTRQISYIARSGLFKFRPLGWLISTLNSISLKEDSGDAAAIREIIRRLEHGDAVLIFPEGARSPDGAMQEFKRGIALLVKKARCPVVPIAVEGCYDAWPRDRKVPRLFRRRVGVLFGNPIPYDELMKDGPDAALQRLHAEVAALLRELQGRMGR